MRCKVVKLFLSPLLRLTQDQYVRLHGPIQSLGKFLLLVHLIEQLLSGKNKVSYLLDPHHCVCVCVCVCTCICESVQNCDGICHNIWVQ